MFPDFPRKAESIFAVRSGLAELRDIENRNSLVSNEKSETRARGFQYDNFQNGFMTGFQFASSANAVLPG